MKSDSYESWYKHVKKRKSCKGADLFLYPKLDAEAIMTKKEEKPPLGLTPRHLHEELRFDAVKDAIDRYLICEKKIPVEWIEEYNDILSRHEN